MESGIASIILEEGDETYIKISAEKSVELELSDFFTFEVPNWEIIKRQNEIVSRKKGKPNPLKNWDGKIRLYKRNTKKTYRGLVSYIKKFARDRNYQVIDNVSRDIKQFSLEQLQCFIESLNLPEDIESRDYQEEYILDCINNERALVLSPTSSGKTIKLYVTACWFDTKTLIVVPTTSLVEQTKDSFKNKFEHKDEISIIYSGKEKEKLNQFVISTWQSIYKMPKEWFEQFECVIVDEVHLAESKSITTVMEKCVNARYRFGFTGTLKSDEMKAHRLTLEGLFGGITKRVTTRQLVDMGYIAEPIINCIVFDHEEKLPKKTKYHDEKKYIVEHEKRNKFLKNLIRKLNGNTLVLYEYVDDHGKKLFEKFQEANKNIHIVHGGIKATERNEIRKYVDQTTNNVIVASFGTFSTGIDIVNINNLVIASPFGKSIVRVLQSIGRGLRKGDEKQYCNVYDIADDLINGKKGYTLRHLEKRIEIYSREEFIFKIKTLKI